MNANLAAFVLVYASVVPFFVVAIANFFENRVTTSVITD